MVEIQKEIQAVVFKSIKTFGVEAIRQEDVEVEIAPGHTKADYATNAAFIVAKKVSRKPDEVAQRLVELLKKDSALTKLVEKVEAQGGFINVLLSKEYSIENLYQAVRKGERFGKGNNLKGKKIMVEFTDPNPFKEFHIGHLYSNVAGESLARLLEWQRATVKRANYQGDVGMHVAKALWGMQEKLKKMPIETLKKQPLQVKMKFLGEAYALGAKAFEEDKEVQEQINELNRKIYQLDPEAATIYHKGRAWSLEYFETLYKRLGTRFDFYYFEREAGKEGLKIVEEYLKKGVFERSKGAIIFKGEKHGLHTRVFVNAMGFPTYEAKELGLAFLKYQDFHYDTSIIVTGNEVNEYFKVVMAALQNINPELQAKTIHISHGMVRFQESKMSSRKGNVITGEWLLDEAKKRAFTLIDATKNAISDKQKERLAEEVGLAAIKYSLLKHSPGKDILFSFEESINFEGNSGPYLQYTYARTQSIRRKAKRNEASHSFEEILPNPEERALLTLLLRFPEIIRGAANTYSPNILCTFLFELAQTFNNFYSKYRVIGSEKEAFRLSLVLGVGNALKNGLALLGIQSPEKM